MLTVSSETIGFFVWLLWALIGVFCALLASRFTGGRRSLWFDIIIATVSAVLGGYLSTQFLGDTPIQLFLISIMSAVFSAGIMMWIVGALINHFRKDIDD